MNTLNDSFVRVIVCNYSIQRGWANEFNKFNPYAIQEKMCLSCSDVYNSPGTAYPNLNIFVHCSIVCCNSQIKLNINRDRNISVKQKLLTIPMIN